jgi:hypothetical protein
LVFYIDTLEDDVMGKIIFCVIALAVTGCAGGGKAAAVSAPAGEKPEPPAAAKDNPPGMDLDAAIKDAAVKMGKSLPAKTEVALVSVASSSAQFSEYVIARLEAALVDDGKLIVLDRANLDKVREEQGLQLSGEVDDNSAKAIGKLVGAGAIVTGSFINLGDVYGLSLKAINMETAAVAASYPADIAKSTRIETLLTSVGGGAGGGASSGVRSGTAAKPPASAPVPAPRPVPAATPAPTPPAAAEKVYKVGDTGPAGGIVFYDKFSSAGGWRYLEAAPAETEQKFPWGDVQAGTSLAIGDGKRNTQLIVEELRKKKIGGAAQYCDELEYGGYTDWFLPSRDELDLMYRNIKEKGLGGFGSGWYWSSSVSGYNYSYCEKFSDGQTDDLRRNSSFYVRPIRQF